MRLDSSLCSALVACWRSWLPSLPGVAGGWARRDFSHRRQLFFVCRGLVPSGSQHASTPFLFLLLDSNGPWAACDVPLLKEAPNCFKDFQRRIYCLYALEMIRYFVSYLCHICGTFYLKAVRAQQELDMLRQARISSAYVCLWSVVSSYDLLTHDFTSFSLCFRVWQTGDVVRLPVSMVYGWLMMFYVTDLTLKQWIAITAQDRSSTAVMQKYIARTGLYALQGTRHRQDEGTCRQLSEQDVSSISTEVWNVFSLTEARSFYSVNTVPGNNF
eukprot:g10249.t1